MLNSVLRAHLALVAAYSGPSSPKAAQTPQVLCVSPSLKRARNGRVEIAYRTVGGRSGEPLLLIPGSGMQLVDWPEPLLGGLVQAGYFLIMPDLRDAGCSTKLDKLGLPDWSRILGEMAAGRRASPDYSVDDMVSDMSAVLDAEGVKSAHVLGASGGSLIAEVMAMQRPLRVRSLTLLMANAGNPARAIPANPRLMSSVAQTPISTDELELENYLASLERVLTGPNAPGEAVLRRRAQVRIARGYSSNGVQRQGAAFLASGDLRQQLTMVSVPTTVIHGAEDPLIPVDAGRDVALSVPNARFQVLPRSGHALDPDMVAAALQALQQGTLEKKRR